MAFGTETLPKVDKITGPGNIFVATAKKQVYGIVGIDMIAGPSEIGVIADSSANPSYEQLIFCLKRSTTSEHAPFW